MGLISLKKERRRNRCRYRIRLVARDLHRLSVFRSNLNTYVQLIDDIRQITVASASTLDKVLRGKFKSGSTVSSARLVGLLIADRAMLVGVKKVVFDRGSYKYHGRVRALAEAAREGGLSF